MITFADGSTVKLMTGIQFKIIRNRLKLSRLQLARALGFPGSPNSVRSQISRYEQERRKITPQMARLMIMFDRHGVPSDFIHPA